MAKALKPHKKVFEEQKRSLKLSLHAEKHPTSK